MCSPPLAHLAPEERNLWDITVNLHITAPPISRISSFFEGVPDNNQELPDTPGLVNVILSVN